MNNFLNIEEYNNWHETNDSDNGVLIGELPRFYKILLQYMKDHKSVCGNGSVYQ